MIAGAEDKARTGGQMKKIWSAIFEKGRSVHRKASVSFKSDRSIFCETRLARFYDARNERGLRMKYSFDEVIDRTGYRCAIYDERLQKFGRADVLPLWVADMDFKTAQPIIDACVAKAKEGIWGYTSRPDSYFQAVQDWQLRRNQWKPDTKLMSWSLGVVPAMSAILHIFSDPQDRILIQTPVYSDFCDIVEDSGRIVVENRLLEQNGRWQIDFDDFARKARTCRIFLICSPHNSVGRVWSRDELTRMAQICIENDVLIVSDEIHSDLIFNGCRHIPTASLSEDIGRHVITAPLFPRRSTSPECRPVRRFSGCEEKRAFRPLLGRHGHSSKQRLRFSGDGSVVPAWRRVAGPASLLFAGKL